MSKDTLKTASVLAFERKLDNSDGLFSAGQWENIENGHNWPGIVVREKSVRGTISNRLKGSDKKAKDPAKLDSEIQNANLQTVDVASLQSGADTLRLHFTLKILPGAGTPSACNSAPYRSKLMQTVDSYVNTSGFGDLALRYACNLANGRYLWRNRLGAEQVKVVVRFLQEGKEAQRWEFNALDFSLRSFDDVAKDSIQSLAKVIEQGFSGEHFVLFEVIAYARIGTGQEVFPSQELILDKGSKNGGKSKTLYSVGCVAAMHSQKVGNALRTIDTWYPNPDGDDLGPIAVEPYGSVTSQGKAYRHPKDKMDFYNLLDGWVLKGLAPDLDQQHFVMATLIRGGVFGDAN